MIYCVVFGHHYGWLWEELTLLSEMYAMDVTRCNSAKEFPVPNSVSSSAFTADRVDEAIRLQKTNASKVPPENFQESELHVIKRCKFEKISSLAVLKR